MKFVSVSLSSLLLAVPVLLGQTLPMEQPLRPLLGTSFGEVLEVQGRILLGDETGEKANQGTLMIEVRTVGDRALPKPVRMEVRCFPFAPVDLPKHGEEARLRGYETGAFTGIPDQAFEDIPRVATGPHQFVHQFQVTKLLSTNPPSS